MPVLKGVNSSPIKGVKLAEGDISQPDENLKVENASLGSTEGKEFSSNTEIEAHENRVRQTDSTNEGTRKRIPARTQLHGICASKKWKLPLYECCKEEGPNHMRMFTFKVIVEIEEASKTLLECFSDPHSKKKLAAEQAAEAALWYLNRLGYQPKN